MMNGYTVYLGLMHVLYNIVTDNKEQTHKLNKDGYSWLCYACFRDASDNFSKFQEI